MGRLGVPHRKHRHMQKVARRYELRIRHLVDELHHKLALWLANTYEVILMPKFNVKSVATKRDNDGQWKRKITKNTVSQLYTLAQYRFRQFLLHKAREHGATVLIVNEAYTTKTCSCCGHMHEVGGAETFACPHCSLVIDRDINASINVLLKFIHDN